MIEVKVNKQSWFPTQLQQYTLHRRRLVVFHHIAASVVVWEQKTGCWSYYKNKDKKMFLCRKLRNCSSNVPVVVWWWVTELVYRLSFSNVCEWPLYDSCQRCHFFHPCLWKRLLNIQRYSADCIVPWHKASALDMCWVHVFIQKDVLDLFPWIMQLVIAVLHVETDLSRSPSDPNVSVCGRAGDWPLA